MGWQTKKQTHISAAKIKAHKEVKHHTLVCRGGVCPRVSLQNTLAFPTDCLMLLPLLIITTSVPGKHCSKNSAFSWNRGGPDWMRYCNRGIESAAAIDCARETSAGQADQACLRRNNASNAASCVASDPVLRDVTRWGMLSVAGSVALKRGKFPNSAFSAFRYSSLTVPVAHRSFSIAARRKGDATKSVQTERYRAQL